MPVQVRIPDLLQDATSGQAQIPVEASTVRDLIDALDVSEYRDLLFILDKLGRRLRDMHQRPEVTVGRAGMEDHTEGAA